MLRLSSTTLSLTITEVKEFDRRLRFKKYLAREDSLGKLPIRTKKVPVVQRSIESEHEQDDISQSTQGTISKDYPIPGIETSPRRLAYRPRRPRRSGGDSAESSSQGIPGSSQSGNPTLLNTPRPTGWGNLPMTLPPPFSREMRSVSDAQSLPSTRHDGQTQAVRTDAAQEPPETPPRRSSLRATQTDIRSNSPTPRGNGRRLVGSAVRFVESMVRSPSYGSPSSDSSPSSHTFSSFSSSPTQDRSQSMSRSELRLRIYNDALPASSQPQTPHNLPEARHRSRLHGAYTAPLPRRGPRSVYHSNVERGRGGTINSPSSFDTPGFHGLYSGRENAEDSTLFYEASEYREESSIGGE
ncbi:uncharacterized protein F4822DRAFT_435150 [Hypoxylon trugodes]|uniref:uncharacterized protein n=1 Tax=Hypoxylon trugodes TaxID=326681 RepID=UPI002198B94D|nr:uncharacterized protein F4822DRAFT_435150 [Hypoxylon trugodes]KAI1382773.1 hypothetical protein F4822DRAFT_435150 [Hypoxylon trugodes]